MKVAILSNENQVQYYIEMYFQNVQVMVFYPDFHNVLECFYDICIIDVEIMGENALKLAREYNGLYGKSKIVYMSEDNTLIYNLIKENMYYFMYTHKLKDNIKVLYHKYFNNQNTCIEIIHDRNHNFIEVHDIMYIVSTRNIVYIHTIDNSCYEVYSSLNQMMEKIDSTSFYRINYQEVINLFYVKRIIGRNIVLTNGIETIISRAKIKEFVTFYRNYKGIK